MTTKNTETNKTTTTKAKATATKAVAAPKKEKPVATPKKVDFSALVPLGPSTNPYQKELIAEFKKRSDNIKKSIGGIDKSMETIAFNLYWIYLKEAYKSVGCENIVQYAEKNFGYSKSTCYSFISVVEKFAAKDDNGVMLEKFDSSVKGYSISKLSLMTGLTDEQLKSLKPEMSVREIAKYVRSLQGEKICELPEGNSDGETDGTEEDNVVDSLPASIGTQPLCVFNSLDDYNSKLDRFDDIVHNLFKIYGSNDGANRDVKIIVTIEHGGVSPLGGKGQFYIKD